MSNISITVAKDIYNAITPVRRNDGYDKIHEQRFVDTVGPIVEDAINKALASADARIAELVAENDKIVLIIQQHSEYSDGQLSDSEVVQDLFHRINQLVNETVELNDRLLLAEHKGTEGV